MKKVFSVSCIQMKKIIDLNCDMSEGYDTDELIMPYISSANIACGAHAGDEDTIKKTILLAMQYDVAIGAHPSYHDREGFGRREMHLDPDEIFNLVKEQTEKIITIANKLGANLHHVKPHGALYNRSAKDADTAVAIAKAVAAVDKSLILYGMPNTESEKAAHQYHLNFYAEVFADRTYTNEGLLTPRTAERAMIDSAYESLDQVIEMINLGRVTSTTGKSIPIKADTICIHGDGEHAVEFAKTIAEGLKSRDIEIHYNKNIG